ncbi:unnamed protein product, partial [Rangifer tarandus platyrhynchus]
QGYWNGLLFPSSGDLSDAGIKPVFPAKPIYIYIYVCMYVYVYVYVYVCMYTG